MMIIAEETPLTVAVFNDQNSPSGKGAGENNNPIFTDRCQKTATTHMDDTLSVARPVLARGV